jgi:micrococcal nuclease
MYEYKIKKVNKIIDGDTIDIDIDLGFNITISQRVRLAGINAPETKTKDLKEKENGIKSKEWLENKLNTKEQLTIKTEKDDKYGRILGWIYIEENQISINNQMIEEGYAISYLP